MKIKDTDVQKISIAQLQPNEGQLEEIGIHANPRQITEDEYNALKASIQTDDLTGIFPLKVYQHEGVYVVLGGNMRLRALQEMGAKEVSCIVIPKNIPAEKLNKIIITDNSTFGDWDMDALANEWTDEPLKDWGVDVPEAKQDEEKETDGSGIDYKEQYAVIVTCANEEEQEAVYNKLVAEGYECKVVNV